MFKLFRRHKFKVGQRVRVKNRPDIREGARNAVVTIVALPGSSELYPDSYEIDLYLPPHDRWWGKEDCFVPIDDKYDGNTTTTWDKVDVWKPKTTKSPQPAS